MLDDETVERFAELGITAVVQPINLRSEAPLAPTSASVPSGSIGPTPSGGCSTPASPLAGSSDAPIEATDVLAAMAAAVDRPTLGPEQAITGAEALALFTTGASAPAAPRTASGVSLPGLRADLVVLDRDPTSIPAGELGSHPRPRHRDRRP